jgi:hypothetical protein
MRQKDNTPAYILLLHAKQVMRVDKLFDYREHFLCPA